MAKNIIMALICLLFIFVSAACEFTSDRKEISQKEKMLRSPTPLFIETYPVAEGEMAASPFPTKPAPKTVSAK